MVGAVAIETKRFVGERPGFPRVSRRRWSCGSRYVNLHMAARERGHPAELMKIAPGRSGAGHPAETAWLIKSGSVSSGLLLLTLPFEAADRVNGRRRCRLVLSVERLCAL